VLAKPFFGVMFVRHGHGAFRPLRSLADVPIGSELDTTHCAVRLIVAQNARGATSAVTVSGEVHHDAKHRVEASCIVRTLCAPDRMCSCGRRCIDT
jgi:hypothetical protein